MVQQIKNDTDYPKHEKADAIVGEQHVSRSAMHLPQHTPGGLSPFLEQR